MEGILLVDKPENWTSFDVVNYVRRKVANIESKKPRSVKVGHIGTLDPAATGLLVLCVGKYTKRVPEMIKKDKIYQVEITLGKTSTTGDKEGDITVESSNEPEIDTLYAALNKFIGDIQQTPPAYSAIKINGKRAYELARAGKKVEIKPRIVKIYSITEIEYNYPLVKFTTKVGSGTYIRSLAEDIGKELATGAYMSNLRRTAIGEFSLSESVPVDDINEEFLEKSLAANR